ncbi:MAG: phosphotransferase [Rhodopirellula sp.]|nr:phosphotransferase [Rhodopirellula sp.]
MSSPWLAEFDITEQLVRQLLDEQFPEFAGKPLHLLGEGWDNAAWQIGDDWVFRFPRRQMGADLIASEFAVVPAIADRLTAAVACPRRIGQPTVDFPWPFGGYPLISGAELCQAAPAANQRLALAEELGDFLRSLHSVSAEEALQLGAPRDMLGRLDIERRSYQAREYLAKAAALRIIDSAACWEKLLDHLGPLCKPPGTDCLVHGDLYSRHLIVKSPEAASDGTGGDVARLAGIIDWGDLHAGDPSVDLACAWSLFDVAGRRRLFHRYGEVPEETRALSRLRAISHSSVCVVYGREGNLPALEQASKDALFWLLED